MVETRAQVWPRPPETAKFPMDLLAELSNILGSAIGHGFLGLVPDSFVRVQLGCVPGKVLHLQPRVASEELANLVALVDRTVVPQDDDRPPQMPQEMPQKVADLRAPNVRLVHPVVQPDPVLPRADREPGNDRHLVMLVPVVERGRPASGSPGPTHGAGQHEARFVHEDEVGPQLLGPFLIRGRSAWTHRAIFSSSRWRARRSGF